MERDGRAKCPFCEFTVATREGLDFYTLMEHVELSHSEDGPSPFLARDGRSRSRSRGRIGAEQDMPNERHQTSRSISRGSNILPFLPEDEDVYVECPLQCGEAVHLRELDDHLELHDIESTVLEDHGSRDPSPAPRSSSARPASSLARNSIPGRKTSEQATQTLRPRVELRRPKQSSLLSSRGKATLLGPAPKKPRTTRRKSQAAGARRLGKAELGPHAFEDRMPEWLSDQLQRGPGITLTNQISSSGEIVAVERIENETSSIIPVLAQLCEQDRSLSKVFLCHPGVKHVFKMAREGGFCGYRNIQMAISFIQAARYPGCQFFPGRTPSILRLQELIEAAWDQGFNSTGRVETGGIMNTRKFIGTPEAQALFCSLGIRCEASAISKQSSNPEGVHDTVNEAVLKYFSRGVRDPSTKVYETTLPPIYFQHPGHSLTIVGLEVRKSGSMNLLVLDPMFKTSPMITGLVGARFRSHNPASLLKAYRRGDGYLGKYQSFEILQLVPPPTHEPPS